jgi:RNA polymerase sigma-70 factor (ECF subfamily)
VVRPTLVKAVDSALNSSVESPSNGNDAALPNATPTPSDRAIDAALLARAANGDARAFRELVERHQRRAYSVAYGLVRNAEDAREVVQEAFIRVFRHRAEFAGQASFSTWLYRIVVNLSIDLLRKRSPGKGIEFDENVDTEGAPDEFIPRRDGTDPFATLDRKRLVEAMHKALEQLPPYHRAVILLRELEGLSYEEMATALEVSKGTIMSRLFHARRKMQRLLKEQLGDEVPDVQESEP